MAISVTRGEDAMWANWTCSWEFRNVFLKEHSRRGTVDVEAGNARDAEEKARKEASKKIFGDTYAAMFYQSYVHVSSIVEIKHR